MVTRVTKGLRGPVPWGRVVPVSNTTEVRMTSTTTNKVFCVDCGVHREAHALRESLRFMANHPNVCDKLRDDLTLKGEDFPVTEEDVKTYVRREYAVATVSEILDASWEARAEGDLTLALALDDLAEDRGASSDDRATCYSCQTWANHSHDMIVWTTKVYEWPQRDLDQFGTMAKVYPVQTVTVP